MFESRIATENTARSKKLSGMKIYFVGISVVCYGLQGAAILFKKACISLAGIYDLANHKESYKIT